ncbi:MAG TPA: thioesterase family protein [Thermodesulfobacteriota bacterium]|nr:thioesterase family protein [Thermodesulfobacteriota bacterium]
MPRRARAFETRVRVAYADTDQMGTVYHANYLVWMERGRTEAMRELGLPYAALEARGLRLPVIEAGLRFLRPARYDELLVIATTFAALGRVRLRFHYEVRHADRPEGPLLVDGFTEHAFVTPEGRVVRVPDDVRALVEPVVAGEAAVPARAARPLARRGDGSQPRA